MTITACIDLPLHCVCVYGLVKNDIKGSDLYILILERTQHNLNKPTSHSILEIWDFVKYLSVILLFLGTPYPHFDKKVVNINCFSRLDKQ